MFYFLLNYLPFTFIPHNAYYMTCQFYPSWLDNSSYIWRLVKIMVEKMNPRKFRICLTSLADPSFNLLVSRLKPHNFCVYFQLKRSQDVLFAHAFLYLLKLARWPKPERHTNLNILNAMLNVPVGLQSIRQREFIRLCSEDQQGQQNGHCTSRHLSGLHLEFREHKKH